MLHIRGNHIFLIAGYYARNLIRGGTGILFTLAALFVGLLIGGIFIQPLEAMAEALKRDREQFRQQQPGIPQGREIGRKDIVDEVTKQVGVPVAKWATGGDDELAEFLVLKRPALVSAILIVLIFCIPGLICLGAFNQLAGDIQYRGLRYLLLRTERANLFFGRFVGTVLFTMVVMAVVILVLFLYLAFKADFYPAGDVFVALLHGYFAVVMFSIPYIALCAWISAAMDGAFVSLVICELVAIFPVIFVAISRGIHKNFGVLGYALPWQLKYTLLHPNPLYVLGAVAYMLAFTALFLFLGMMHFQKRDL
jgi:hypothetical protein